MILNNAKIKFILSLVRTKEARNNNKSFVEAASKSGAQIIITDYYQKSTHSNLIM
jgi:hypothetical protein